MTRIQKEEFFRLLKVASSCYNQYTKDKFAKKYRFTDDVVKKENPARPKVKIFSQKEIVRRADAISACANINEILEKLKVCKDCALSINKNTQDIADFESSFSTKTQAIIVTLNPLQKKTDEFVLLEKMLAAINLKLGRDVAAISVVWCNSLPVPRSEQSGMCLPFTKTLLKLANPRVILCFGDIAAKLVFGLDQDILSLRTKFQLYEHQRKVAVTYALEKVAKDERYKPFVWKDLQKVQAYLSKE